MSRYATPAENEWVQPVRRNYKLACCDCGLVHKLDFRIHNGRVQFRARRARASTALMRRQKASKKTVESLARAQVMYAKALENLARK